MVAARWATCIGSAACPVSAAALLDPLGTLAATRL